MDQVIFTPNIVQTVAGAGQIEFKYLSSTLTGNTTVRLTPTFITEQVRDRPRACDESILDLYLSSLAQETSANLTLMHDVCLPGYFLVDRECICEETGTVALCDPGRTGILLAVRKSIIRKLYTYRFCVKLAVHSATINRMDCGEHLLTGAGS